MIKRTIKIIKIRHNRIWNKSSILKLRQCQLTLSLSFLIISINSKYYLLDGNDIINFIENNNKKSIPYEYIDKNGILIEAKIKPRLDYIKAIDKKYF